MTYPEHEKMAIIQDESNAIGQFLEWLEGEAELTLCILDGDDFMPARQSITKLLALYFEIDLNKVENEKQHMLGVIRGEIDPNEGVGE